MTDERSEKRIYCNTCKIPTWHSLLFNHDYQTPEDASGSMWCIGTFRLWVCSGCDTATLEDTYGFDCWDQIDPVPEIDPDAGEVIFWPKRREHERIEKQFIQLPDKLKNLYREVIGAVNEQFFLLCAAGLRSLVEGICADKGIKGKSLEEKIEGLVGLLPENIVAHLHSFRFMGNQAVHELKSFSSQDLCSAIDVVEDLLNFLYELDYKASKLAKHAPSAKDTSKQEASKD